MPRRAYRLDASTIFRVTAGIGVALLVLAVASCSTFSEAETAPVVEAGPPAESGAAPDAPMPSMSDGDVPGDAIADAGDCTMFGPEPEMLSGWTTTRAGGGTLAADIGGASPALVATVSGGGQTELVYRKVVIGPTGYLAIHIELDVSVSAAPAQSFPPITLVALSCAVPAATSVTVGIGPNGGLELSTSEHVGVELGSLPTKRMGLDLELSGDATSSGGHYTFDGTSNGFDVASFSGETGCTLSVGASSTVVGPPTTAAYYFEACVKTAP